MLCPVCDGEGQILRVLITKLRRQAFLCDECDSLWLDDHKFDPQQSLAFDQFMKAHNLPGLWSEVEILGSVDQ